MEYVIVFLIIYILSATIAVLINRKIDETVPIGVVGIILIIYLFGLFDNLKAGVTVVKIVSVISSIFVIYLLKRNKEKRTKKERIEQLITPGIVIFIMYIMISIILNRGRVLEFYDNFNHWALIVKNMFIYNGFGTVENSVVSFNEYPPFTAIFQYLFINIKGEYAEDTIIIAHNILYFSMIIPLLRNVTWKKGGKKLIMIMPTIIFMPIIFYQNFYTEILVDGFIGILFGLGLYEIYLNDENKYILLGTYIISIALIKNIGIIFAIILIILEIINTKKEKKSLKEITAIILVTAILVGSWYIKITLKDANLNWGNPEAIYLQEGQEENKNQVIKNFINKIINKDQGITVMSLSVLMCISIYITYSMFLYQKLKKEKRQKRYISIFITMILTTIIYMIGMLMVYLTLFEEEETQVLSSFNRYISTILIAGFFSNTIILLENIQFKAYYLTVIITILIIFLPIEDIEDLYVRAKQHNTLVMAKRSEYGKITKYRNVFNENDKIYFVTNKLSDYYFAIAISKYEMMPILIGNKSAVNFENNLKEELENGYTYIYVLNPNTQFNKAYENAFKNKIEFQGDSLYKINKTEEGINVEKILIKDIIDILEY